MSDEHIKDLEEFFKNFEENSKEKHKLLLDFNAISTEINTIGDIEITIKTKEKKLEKNDSIIKEVSFKNKQSDNTTNLF